MSSSLRPERTHSDVEVSESEFGDQVLQVCRVLEEWSKGEQRTIDEDPNELPNTDWRVAAHALVFFGLGGLVILVESWLEFVQGYGTLGLYSVLLAISGGAGSVLSIAAPGMFKRQFWRAIKPTFRKKDNYPFTPLLRRTERDLAATSQLSPFTPTVLAAVQERLTILGSDLRERLGLLSGGSAIPTILSLALGVWSAWKSVRGEPSVLSMAGLGGGIMVLWLTAYAFHLRFSLLELSRCRALVALELARRKATTRE